LFLEFVTMRFILGLMAFAVGVWCFDWSGARKTPTFVRLANMVPVSQSLEQLQANNDVLSEEMKQQIKEIDATAATLENQPIGSAGGPLAKYCEQLNDLRALAKLSREQRDKLAAEIEENLASWSAELKEMMVPSMRVELEDRLRQSTSEFRKTLAATDASIADLDQIIVQGNDLEIIERCMRRESKIRGATASMASLNSELGSKVAEFRSATKSVMIAWNR